MRQHGMNGMLSGIKTLNDALKSMKKKGIQHFWYCHYTSLDKLKQMIESKTMWLTRCSSLTFDDAIEGRKYGSRDETARRYIACFTIGRPENAAMWGLYCPPTYKAIRISFPKKAMHEWVKGLDVHEIVDGKVSDAAIRNASAFFSDLVYASVKHDDDDRDRANTISWEGEFSGKIANLEEQKRCVGATGRVKDYEWRFEREARLFVKIRDGRDFGERIAVRLPDSVIRSMRFTFSPWADKDEESYVRDKVSMWVRNALSAKHLDWQFEESVLNNGLSKWAASRGLS